MTCTFEVFTLFPEAIDAFARAGLLGKALERGVVELHCTNYRDFTSDKHRTVDDTPFGGGAGMVIKPEPVVAALEHVTAARGPMHRVLLTPSAPRFDQSAAQRLAAMPRVGLLCGRYEGIDDRIREHFVDECLSIGDFVLGGGEVASLVVIEAVSRLIDGVLGNPNSAIGESFTGPWLEFPQYTRPAEFRGYGVPPVLLGGNHQAIEEWRLSMARQRTWALRPDLRSASRLPASTEVHLVLPATMSPDPSLAMAPIEGVVLFGEGAEDAVMGWAATLRGSPPVSAFGQLKALRKRLRRRHGEDPFVVDLIPVRDAQEDIPRDPRVVLDALAAAVPPHGSALVLRLRTGSMGLSASLSGPSADASLALDLAHDRPPSGDPKDDQLGLATSPTIEDASRPPMQVGAALSRALAALIHRHDER